MLDPLQARIYGVTKINIQLPSNLPAAAVPVAISQIPAIPTFTSQTGTGILARQKALRRTGEARYPTSESSACTPPGSIQDAKSSKGRGKNALALAAAPRTMRHANPRVSR
jgi:hypothetical protein